ncbi:SusC/RagA family TonB-linked outer membrane protein [Hymenobacter jeollabukensis]
MDVTLGADTKQLSEIVVTAVGIERQEKALAYSTDVISSRSLTQGRDTNPIAALQGKVAGVNIGKSSGGVNSSTRITLRGTRSFQGENQPLFVVDGIIIDNTSIQPSTGSTNQVDVGNRVGDINPDDIESITVLKGPSAAALYGSAGGNGAIIITTKTGRDAAAQGRKAAVTFNSSFTAETVLKLPDFQNEFGSGYDLETYVPFENTNYGPRFDGKPVQLGPPAIDGSVQTIPYSAVRDNVKNFFNTGTTFQNSVALQGGNEKANYYLSFSDATQKGIIPDDKFRRNTLKLTAGSQLTQKLSATTSISYNHNKTDVTFQGSGNGSVLNNVLNTSRQVDLENYKDFINNKFATLDGWFSGYYDNPYRSIADNRYVSNLDRVLGNATLNYAPLDWLSFTYRAGADISFDRRKERNAIRTYTSRRWPNDGSDYAGQAIDRPANNPGRLAETDIFISNITTDLLATVKRDVTPDINVTFIAGGNIFARTIQQTSQTANALSIPGYYNLANRVGEITPSDDVNRRRRVGIYGDLTLGFRNYLFLNATARNDWSSTLSPDARSYFYPSVGLSYVFTESIAPLKDNKILTYGKIRASYAKVGNDATAYQLINTFPAATGFPYGSLPSFTVSNLSRNPNLKPEQVKTYEAGLEFGLLNDRIGGEVTYYKTTSSDLITQISVPYSTGFTQAVLNVGKVENKGLESSLRFTPVRTSSGLRIDVGANFSFIDSKVLELFPNVSQLDLGSGDPVPSAIVGQPFPVLKGSAYLRDPQGRIVVDASGYPRKDPTLQILGRVNPKYIIGGNLTVAYKGVRLAAVVDARKGAVLWSGTRSTLAFTGSSLETASNGRESFVIPNTVVQNSDGSYSPNTKAVADGGFEYWYNRTHGVIQESNIIKADYLKLREVSLTYDLPKALLEKSPFGRASIGFSGRNLLLFVPSDNKFIDPEASLFGTNNSQGREYNNIPSTRSYGANLSVTF